MFARLKDTIRILTYHSPEVHGPDAVIVESRDGEKPSAFGKFIAFTIEGFVCIYAVGFIAGRLGDGLFHLHRFRSVSLTTIVGALGALLFWISHGLMSDAQKLLRARLNLAEKLAPYFGHKVEETYRALRG